MPNPFHDFHPTAFGYLNMPVLDKLWGRECDEKFLSFIYALRPSDVVISKGGILANFILWRVHIVIDDHNRVVKATQTVEIALPRGVRDGGEMVKWFCEEAWSCL